MTPHTPQETDDWVERMWQHILWLNEHEPAVEPGGRTALLIENWVIFQEYPTTFTQGVLDRLRAGENVAAVIDSLSTEPHRRALRIAEGEVDIRRILREDFTDSRRQNIINDEDWSGHSIPGGMLWHFVRFRGG
jgi:hypothetical protein